MARLPYPDPCNLGVPVREALDALPALNIFQMLAHAETAFVPFLHFGGTLLGTLQLDPKLRELAILQVAGQTGAQYEWVQHDTIARAVGVTDAQIAAVEQHDFGSAALDERGRAVLRFTEQVIARPRVDDEAFAALCGCLVPREIVELLLVVGNYLMLARVMTTLELEIDASVGTRVVDASTQAATS